MMVRRSDHVRCVAHPVITKHVFEEDESGNRNILDYKESICGRRLRDYEWCFTGLDHAFGNAKDVGRLLVCWYCLERAKEVLEPHSAKRIKR